MFHAFQIRAAAICLCVQLPLSGGCGPKVERPELPKVPVQVTFREAAFGKGYVAQFKNETGRHLAVAMVLENATLKQRRESQIQLTPKGTTEYGWLEGWSFVSSEVITLSHEDYSPVSVRVP